LEEGDDDCEAHQEDHQKHVGHGLCEVQPPLLPGRPPLAFVRKTVCLLRIFPIQNTVR
jgi:hypothetical protein